MNSSWLNKIESRFYGHLNYFLFLEIIQLQDPNTKTGIFNIGL